MTPNTVSQVCQNFLPILFFDCNYVAIILMSLLCLVGSFAVHCKRVSSETSNASRARYYLTFEIQM